MARNQPIDPAALNTPDANSAENANLDEKGDPKVSPESEAASQRATDPNASQIDPPNGAVNTAPEKKKWKKGEKAFVHNPNPRPMRDPYTEDRFPPGEVVRVKELGNWTIMQLEAGILLPGDPDLVGVKPKSDDK